MCLGPDFTTFLPGAAKKKKKRPRLEQSGAGSSAGYLGLMTLCLVTAEVETGTAGSVAMTGITITLCARLRKAGVHGRSCPHGGKKKKKLKYETSP